MLIPERASNEATAEALAAAHRRERGMARWRARSQLVRRLRLILPAAIGLVLGALFGWVSLAGLIERLGEARPAGQALIHMTNARFFGRDADGRPYMLAAAEASRDDRNLRLITLKLPNLTLDSNAAGGGTSRILADRGVYREDDRTLALAGHVTLRTADGAEFHTEQAWANTAMGLVEGSSPVYGAAPTGEISARRFAIFDRGARVVFSGEVHSRLNRD